MLQFRLANEKKKKETGRTGILTEKPIGILSHTLNSYHYSHHLIYGTPFHVRNFEYACISSSMLSYNVTCHQFANWILLIKSLNLVEKCFPANSLSSFQGCCNRDHGSYSIHKAWNDSLNIFSRSEECRFTHTWGLKYWMNKFYQTRHKMSNNSSL